MIPKRFLNVFVTLSLFTVLAFLVYPNTSNAQFEGCCINAQNNCAGGVTSDEQCDDLESGQKCDSIESNCNVMFTFTPNATCMAGAMGGQAMCVFPEPSTGCCQVDDMCTEDVTDEACMALGGNWGGEDVECGTGPICVPPSPPTGCCQTVDMCDPDVTREFCDNEGGTFMVNTPCDGDVCGEAPPPVDGCCQRQSAVCEDTTDTDCLDQPFFPGGMCFEGEFCEPPPVGCCVIEQGVCEITTEVECDNQGGDYQGNGTGCAGRPQCLLPATNVPTLGQWGLIAVAGLLGIYSLMMIRRRNKYNVG